MLTTSLCGVVCVNLQIEDYILDIFSSVFVLIFGSAMTLVLLAALGGVLVVATEWLDNNKQDDQDDV